MFFSSPLEQFDAIYLHHALIYYKFIFIVYDLSILHVVVPLMILLFIYIKWIIISEYCSIIYVKIYQRIFEYSIKFIFNMIKQQVGNSGFKYLILLYFIFFIVLLSNLLGVFPFGIALTSHLSVILYLSLSICIGIFIEGNIILGFYFYKLFLPKSPLIMIPLLFLIEIFSFIIRMFSLAIRLAANITAGHTLIHIISTFSLMIFYINSFFLIFGVSIICVIMLLELGVAFLQAYVFAILVLIYINDIYNGSH